MRGMEPAEVFVSVATGEVVSQRTHIHRALDRTLYTLGGNCIGTAMGMLPGTKVRKEGDPTSTDTDANNVYDQQSSTYYFYKHLFNRDSYDDKGAGMIATVNVQFPAGFSCSPNNAAWLGSPYFQMAYGKGDGMVLLNLTLGLDVTAHEITHAVTSTTSNLTYQNESGALNEGMSDIMGSGVEAWVASGGTAMGNPAMFKHSADTSGCSARKSRDRSCPAVRCASWTIRPKTAKAKTGTPSASCPAEPTAAVFTSTAACRTWCMC